MEPLEIYAAPDRHMAPPMEFTPAGMPGHDVQFYETDAALIPVVTRFLAEGVRAGHPIVVIATAAHRDQIARALVASQIEQSEVLFGHRSVWLDARDTLAAFMEGDAPNEELFDATVGRIFERLLRDQQYLVVRAFGEMVDLLSRDGKREAALTVERFWNNLAKRFPFSLLCGYSAGAVKETHGDWVRRLEACHTRVLPARP